MRLDVSIFGILTCLAGLAMAQDGNSDRAQGGTTTDSGPSTTPTTPVTTSSNLVIEVEPLPSNGVFKAGTQNKTISYSRGSDIKELNVKGISLKQFDTRGTVAQGVYESESGSTSSTKSSTEGSTGFGAVFHSNEAAVNEAAVGRRQSPPGPVTALPPSIFTYTQDTITLSISDDLSEYGSNTDLPLYYEIQWENSTSKGTSYSQLFAVTTDPGATEATNALRDAGSGTSPAFPEVIDDESSSSENPTASTTTSTSATETPVSLSPERASSSNNGLSTGAVAGIAVGCSIGGLLIIGFLVWFFFIRPRKNRDRLLGTDFAADSGTHAMMPDKEAVGMSQSSPHSTFADDGGRLHDRSQRRSGAPGVSGDDAASYAPYSDRTRSISPPVRNNTLDSQTDVGDNSSTRPPSPPFHSRYAHLIEEGMTEDEIRRLEEEERHLDAAIEDAGRNSRPTRPS